MSRSSTITTVKSSNVSSYTPTTTLEEDNENVNFVLASTISPRRRLNLGRRSVEFADKYSFWLYYIFLIFIVRYGLWIAPFHIFHFWPQWTIVNITHAIVTFFLMHWRKGSATSIDDDGASEVTTFWEALDCGMQYTPTKKFFTIVPIMLFLVASYEHEWKKRYFFVNIVALSLSVIPKMTFMDGIRLLGINK